MKGAVVLATEQGLGRQAKQFYEHGVFDIALLRMHSVYTNHTEWYPNQVNSFEELLDKCDTIFFLETPFDWSYIVKARDRGVKTVMFAMYECTPNPMHYWPDVICGGSIMEKEEYDQPVTVINVPVPDEIVWKERKRAKIFVHNAGHGGLGGRNGTKELIEAIPMVQSEAKFIIRSQFPVKIPYDDPRIEVRVGDFPYESLFSEGDVFIYPDKFGGSCLPLQEAHASGMMVMASNRHPSNTWLPTEPLIPIQGYKTERIVSHPFQSAIVSPSDIAKTIDEWFDKDITEYSIRGKKWGEENSWKALGPIYENL